jgi:two-component system, OmpR family, phosphate regulon response regulator OmpR
VNSRAGEHPVREERAHLLVVDDDSRIRALLARYLTMQGYRITTASSAADARTRMQSLAFDLVVLDVMMPGGNGLSLARDVRRQNTPDAGVPIIFLTARGEIESRIEGLQAGGDDYLAKPFDPRELSLRIASLLRRSTQRDIVVPEERVVRFGEFQFDLVHRELRRGDKRIVLAEREREMLRLLAAARGNVVTRHALATCGTPCNGRSVDVQINRLRRKLEDDPAEPAYLVTARGSGYSLAFDGKARR